jgi:phosphoenolpyruvate phosphomutase|tara:strand:+ start:23 stop:427 length:405 start_codon:yes stop_codon:yes gene_type:complete
MKKIKKKIYVALSADILHEGHINILKKAKSLGEVTVGLLTDKAISSYKKLPLLDCRQREIVLKNIKYVNKVIPQDTLDYTKNLNKLKPDYVVHGDDWKKGIQKNPAIITVVINILIEAIGFTNSIFYLSPLTLS